MKWQPIETAPKDGKRVLVYTLLGDRKAPGSIYVARWTDTHGGHWMDFGVCGNLTIENPYRRHASVTNEEITHWMPLPDAPTD